MSSRIDNIYLSQQAKEQLIKLKRITGIMHWNVLCRWAFCLSIAEQSPPPVSKIPTDSSVEMSWKVFGGAHEGVYDALLKERCRRDGFALTREVMATQFRLHLHRGIGYLAADKQSRDVAAFLTRVLPRASRST